MRRHADATYVFFFEGDVAVDPVFAEHTAAQEEFVVGFEGGQCFFQRSANGWHQCIFFRRQVVEVFIGRVARMDFVLNTIKPAINKAANAKYGLAVGSGKRASMRRALLLFTDGIRMEAERFLAE